MNGILLLLGTNLGTRHENLQMAQKELLVNGVKTVRESSMYESEPWGKRNQPWFLNKIIEVTTNLDPEALLKVLQRVEAKMGRVRTEKWGERLIDIDILFYHDQMVNGSNLKIPHPGIPDRKFTLVPLAELWGDQNHPILNIKLKEMLRMCHDKLKVNLFTGQANLE